MSQADIVSAIENDILKKPGRAAEDVGFLEGTKAAIGRGIESLTGESGMLAGLGLAKTAIAGTEPETKAKMQAIKADRQKPEEAPGMTVEDFQRIYKDRGLLAAAKEVPKYISEQIAQSAPQMAGPLAVGAATSPFITPVGGALAGMATYGVQQFGNFLVRQAQEKDDPKELEITKAALTAAGTAPLGYFADRFTVGLGGSSKKIGEEILQELSARQIAGKVGKGVVGGASRGVIAEAPTEVLEQAAERWQAGLDLTSADAKREYKEAFFGAAAAGGGIGGISGGIRGYADTRTQPITEPDQSGISGAGMQGEAPGGIRTADQTGLDFLSERPEEPLAGTAELNASLTPAAAAAPAPTDFAQIDRAIQQTKLDEEAAALKAFESSQQIERIKQIQTKLNEVNAYIRDLSEVDPQDDRIADAMEYAGRISEEGARLQEQVQAPQKVTALNAPEQGGFDFNAPAEEPKQELSGDELYKAMALHLYDTGKMTLEPSDWAMSKQRPEGLTHEEWFRKTLTESPRLASAFLRNATTKELAEAKAAVQPAAPQIQPKTIAPIEEQEFSLLPPEGRVDTSTEIKPIEIPEYETSKFMFVTPNANPFKALNTFFNSIKPVAVSEAEVKAHQAEVRKLQEAITEFQQDAVGRDRVGRLNTIRNFFDQFNIAPADRQNEITKLPQLMPGMDAQTQQELLAQISQLPNINTVRGMKELNSRLDTAMVDYSEAKLGRSRESAILPWQAHEDVSTRKDAEALKKLSNIAEKAKTPEEKAATTYLTAHADYAFPFASAIRAAAFDLGAEQGPVFRAQNKENAQLFRNWAGKNLDPMSLAKFDATIEEFRQMGDKIRKREFEAEEIAGGKKVGWSAWSKGNPKIMHPSVETRIANNDLPGALRALSRLGTEFQKGLAKRLLKLDLKTSIGVGQQEDFAKYMVQRNAAPELEQIVDMLQTSFPSVFQEHFRNLSDIRATYTALKDLNAGRLGVDKRTLEAYVGQLKEATEAYQAAVAVLDSRGTYMPSLDAININRDKGGNTTATFLHEVLHAATHWALDPVNYDSLDNNQKQAVDELKRMYNTTKGLLQFGNEVSSIDEFVVEAYTNPEFQRFLKDMPLTNTKQTLWNKFTELISKIFGLNNMLGYTLANANDIFMAPPETSKEARALNLQGKLGGYILEDSYRAGPETRSLTDKIFNERGDWDGVKDAIPSFLSGLKDSTRKHFLGALTLRQIEDIVGPRVPPFKEFINRMESMLDDRNATLNKTKDIVKPWMKWQSANPKKGKILNALMLDATRMGIDPDVNNSDEILNRAWNDIGTDGQKIYRQVRDFYANQMKDHIQVLLDRKATALKADGISENAVKSHPEYIALKEHFNKHSIQPYFPIRRFGQYWLQIGKGKTKEFYTFESARERNAFQKKRERELNLQKSDKQISAGNSIKEMVNDNLQDFEFLAKLKDLVARETGNTRKELKDNITDSIEQMFLMTLPDQSIRKMFLNRQGIQGMNQDMLRAFTASAFRIAYQQSRFKHSDSLYGAVDAAESYIEGMDTEERKVYTDYIRELEGRLQYIMNPTDTGGIPSFLSNVSFAWYMTSPASALVNMLGVPAVGIPVVGARFGIGKTSAMMTSYARKFMGTGFKDPQGNWSFPSFTNKPGMFNERQKAAFEQFIADGLIDITLTHDIVGLAETNSNLYTGRTQKVMGVLSAAFHGAEKFNREVVAMSSYDLAYERAKANGLSDDAAQKKAIDEAKELTYKSMFDYSTLNKPRYFQPAYAKVFLQFKQFSQQMTYMLARSAYEGFYKKFDANELQDIGNQINATRTTDGQPALEGPALNAAIKKYIKDFRAEGKKRLIGTLGTTFLFAGATGLPGWSALSAMMEMLNTLFADEDEEDEPFDFNNAFKNWANETFGGFVGDSISRGVVTQASGVNLADRMGLDSMWFRDNRKSADEVSAIEATIVSLMGPAVGLVTNTGNAIKQLNDGHLGRAIETFSPAIIKNALKGARLGSEGALTLGGDVLVEDFSATEIGSQAIGFSPERLAQRQKSNIEMKGAEQEIVKKHQSLLNAFFMAVDSGDDDMKDRVIDKIGKFNRANPGSAITPKGLQASIKRRYQQRALAEQTGGARINKKLIGQLSEMGNYGNPDE
jgi:hypothetical protein